MNLKKMNPANRIIKVNRGYYNIPCSLCGEPVTVARGSLIEEVDSRGFIMSKMTNHDQFARYHKKCRLQGRRMARKQERKLNKITPGFRFL